MNGEHEQCNDCGHVWEHEDDRCPSCGSQDTEEFDVKVRLKENWQRIKALEVSLFGQTKRADFLKSTCENFEQQIKELQEIVSWIDVGLLSEDEQEIVKQALKKD